MARVLSPRQHRAAPRDLEKPALQGNTQQHSDKHLSCVRARMHECLLGLVLLNSVEASPRPNEPRPLNTHIWSYGTSVGVAGEMAQPISRVVVVEHPVWLCHRHVLTRRPHKLARNCNQTGMAAITKQQRHATPLNLSRPIHNRPIKHHTIILVRDMRPTMCVCSAQCTTGHSAPTASAAEAVLPMHTPQTDWPGQHDSALHARLFADMPLRSS